MDQFNKHIFRYLAAVALLTIIAGTIVYHFVEKFSWLNSYYFSVITLSTVGYGDFTPHTDFGKIFTTFYIFVGVGILTTFISYAAKRRSARAEKHESKKQKRDV